MSDNSDIDIDMVNDSSDDEFDFDESSFVDTTASNDARGTTTSSSSSTSRSRHQPPPAPLPRSHRDGTSSGSRPSSRTGFGGGSPFNDPVAAALGAGFGDRPHRPNQSPLATMLENAGVGRMFGYPGMQPSAGVFRQSYNAYSMAILEVQQGRSGYAGRENAMYGGKIIMPASALATLSDLELPGPWTFEIRNASQQSIRTHCGVLEFIAEEGQVHLPQWMMKRLEIDEGDPISIQGAALPKGKLVKLQAQSTLFLELSDPKAVLEQALRNFTCLTVGDIIEITYNSMQFELLVMETQPEGEGISVIDTDLEVDFAAPKGYVEPTPTPREPPPTMASKLNIRTDSTQEVNSRGSGRSTPSTLDGTKTPGSAKTGEVFSGVGSSVSGKRVKNTKAIASKKIEEVSEGSKIYRTDGPRVVTNETDLEGRRVPAALNLPFGHLFFGYPVKPLQKNNQDDESKENENNDQSQEKREGKQKEKSNGFDNLVGGGSTVRGEPLINKSNTPSSTHSSSYSKQPETFSGRGSSLSGRSSARKDENVIELDDSD